MGWIVVVALVLLVMIVIGMYNSLVRLRAACDSAWADIDVQLKRRYDLIPNLVETVKAYAAHEKGALEAVINARAKAMSAQGPEAKGAAETQLTQSLKSLFALAEAYPDLKANQTMMQLSEELSSTENRVAFSRQAFNDAVMTYNNGREMFPGSIVAGMFQFQPAALLEIADPGVREAPKVTF